jgi:hypothetical protein
VNRKSPTLYYRLHDGAIRAVAASAIAGVWLIAGAAPVPAECDGPIPSFRGVVATAKRVVIGQVVAVHPSELSDPASDARSTRFTLRVLETPRGVAPATMEIVDLPTQPCASIVSARVGDRLAIAFDAIDFEPPMRVNTAAWLRGVPPLSEIDSLTAFESTTRAEVYRLLGLEPPDTAVAPAPSQISADPPWGVIAVVAIAGGAAGWLRSGRAIT